MTDLSLFVIAGISLVPLASTTFFFIHLKALSMRQRVYGSTHGLLTVLALVYGITLDTYLASFEFPLAGIGSLLLYILAIASIVYSFGKFSGNRLFHLLHIGTLGYVSVTAPFVVLFVGCASGNCS